MASICAICKSQFSKVLPYYGMNGRLSIGVHQLVSNAIVLTDPDETPDGNEGGNA